jgi:hypothetical protein
MRVTFKRQLSLDASFDAALALAVTPLDRAVALVVPASCWRAGIIAGDS